ncbi:myb family transcription factor [Actinidia rufa]|uniref:Myb family transcription factor n=1 Tax=Actinidia rufa TaxID=165716 RepID=A0A7J0G565_9ERIC|nr:myb family transcription factor [Actinidia rufa]
MGKDFKKEKRSETNASDEASDYAGIVSDRVGDGSEVNKEAKRKQKYKKKAEVSSDVDLDGSRSEKYYEVEDENYQKEEKTKMKKRKLETVGDNNNSNEEIHTGGEERNCLQTDDAKDLGNESALKARKEKKRYKEDRKKDENDSVPYQMDILEVKEMDKDKKKKKKKKGRKDQEIGDFKGKTETTAVEGVEEVRENYSVDDSEMVVKKRKREKKKSKDDLGTGVREMMPEEPHNESTMVGNNGIGDNKDSTHSTRKKKKNGSKGNRKKQDSVETDFENPKPKVKSKKVRFSGEVEVFPSSDGPSKGQRKEPGREISARSYPKGEDRSWTTEELEIIRKHHEEHGAKWKELADTLGKNRVHLKDTWRRIKLPNKKKGHWSQEEYQGDWANTDDYRLLIALFNLDACCIEDVDWDNLLDHRSGDVCRKRWSQMVKHIGKHGTKSFAEQVEILSKRYCPDILEAREAWDSKPAVFLTIIIPDLESPEGNCC